MFVLFCWSASSTSIQVHRRVSAWDSDLTVPILLPESRFSSPPPIWSRYCPFWYLATRALIILCLACDIQLHHPSSDVPTCSDMLPKNDLLYWIAIRSESRKHRLILILSKAHHHRHPYQLLAIPSRIVHTNTPLVALPCGIPTFCKRHADKQIFIFSKPTPPLSTKIDRSLRLNHWNFCATWWSGYVWPHFFFFPVIRADIYHLG